MLPFQEPNKFGCSEGNVFDAETQVCKLAEEVRTNLSLKITKKSTKQTSNYNQKKSGARMRVLVRLPGKQQVWQRLQRRLFVWSSCCMSLTWSWSSPTTTSLTYPCPCPSPSPLFCTCCFSQVPTFPLRHRATHPYIEKRAFQVSIYWTSKLA